MQSRVRQFMDLPLELRLMIWKYALRPLSPDRPGAHFFSVVDNDEGGSEASSSSTKCAFSRIKGHFSYCENHFAAPRLDSSQGGHSWVVNNPSAYIWDFGMWNACRESRRVITAHYGIEGFEKEDDWTRKPWNQMDDIQALLPQLLSHSQTPFTLISPRKSESCRFVFHAKQDLVCFQAYDANAFAWGGHICVGYPSYSLFDFAHVAIAYDPSWNDFNVKTGASNFRSLYREKSTRGFFIRTLVNIDECRGKRRNYSRNRTFWLIDYNIKRIRPPRKLQTTRKKRVFYGTGRVFSEVDKRLSRRSFSSGRHSSALEFLDNLDILLGGLNPAHGISHGSEITDTSSCYMCDPFEYPRPRTYRIHRGVRVLMCEETP